MNQGMKIKRISENRCFSRSGFKNRIEVQKEKGPCLKDQESSWLLALIRSQMHSASPPGGRFSPSQLFTETKLIWLFTVLVG